MTAHEISSPAAATLPDGHRTFLHIGMFKTGTSYIQAALRRNHALLREQGVYYPLEGKRWDLQVLAARDLAGRLRPQDGHGGWSQLVANIHESDAPTALVSMEWLSLALPERIAAQVTALAPSEVHVIITIRDLVRVIPSDWQSKVKQGRTWSFDEYVASIRSDEPERRYAHDMFWVHHDAVALARRWMQVVPHDRVHLVVVPPPGAPPTLLWERFCSVIGVPSSDFDANVDSGSNISLTYSETEFLRQINTVIGPVMPITARRRWATRYLANSVLRGVPSPEDRTDRPQLDADTHAWVVARARQLVEGLRELDVRVVGDLDEIVPPPVELPAGAGTGPRVAFPTKAADIVGILLRRLAEVSDQAGNPEDGLGETDDGPDQEARKTSRRERRKARGNA